MQFMHQVFIGDKVKHSFDDAESIKRGREPCYAEKSNKEYFHGGSGPNMVVYKILVGGPDLVVFKIAFWNGSSLVVYKILFGGPNWLAYEILVGGWLNDSGGV